VFIKFSVCLYFFSVTIKCSVRVVGVFTKFFLLSFSVRESSVCILNFQSAC